MRRTSDEDPLAAALRSAGCVFAEEEAAILRTAARDGNHLEQLLRRRQVGQPLEHIVGSVLFMGLHLSVGPGVFVPRQRSRFLARMALRALRAAGGHSVFLEAFAGVAPLAAVIQAALPEVEIHVTDIDPAALKHARANLSASASIHVGSVLTGLPAPLRGRIPLIAAVPPYVPVAAGELLPREARDFEPARALFGGKDGLEHIRELMEQSRDWLAPGGRLLMEMNWAECADASRHAELAGLIARPLRGADGQTAILEVRNGPDFRGGATFLRP